MLLAIRAARPDDVLALNQLLNEIIYAGGSTAIETPLNPSTFTDYFLNGPDHLCCFVAEDEDGMLWGFQVLERLEKLPETCVDIATFARLQPKKRGVGTALFAETTAFAQAQGVESINATIRADNTSGLSYYTKMGFVDHAITKAVPLLDGTLVDRVSKRLSIS